MVAIPGLAAAGDRVPHAGAERVDERDEAEEREALDAVLVRPSVGPPRHGQDAEALGGERAVVVLEPPADRRRSA